MAKLILFPTFTDNRGSIAVMDRELPFLPKRFFTIYNFKAPRGGHGHLRSHTVLFALQGRIEVEVRTLGDPPGDSRFYVLDSPEVGLYLIPEDWHAFKELTPGSVLLCVASEHYSKDDYFYEKP
jgi:dTDP-4-dehydrorhamnose 3,5-epimerase-like enzyme